MDRNQELENREFESGQNLLNTIKARSPNKANEFLLKLIEKILQDDLPLKPSLFQKIDVIEKRLAKDQLLRTKTLRILGKFMINSFSEIDPLEAEQTVSEMIFSGNDEDLDNLINLILEPYTEKLKEALERLSLSRKTETTTEQLRKNHVKAVKQCLNNVFAEQPLAPAILESLPSDNDLLEAEFFDNRSRTKALLDLARLGIGNDQHPLELTERLEKAAKLNELNQQISAIVHPFTNATVNRQYDQFTYYNPDKKAYRKYFQLREKVTQRGLEDRTLEFLVKLWRGTSGVLKPLTAKDVTLFFDQIKDVLNNFPVYQLKENESPSFEAAVNVESFLAENLDPYLSREVEKMLNIDSFNIKTAIGENNEKIKIGELGAGDGRKMLKYRMEVTKEESTIDCLRLYIATFNKDLAEVELCIEKEKSSGNYIITDGKTKFDCQSLARMKIIFGHLVAELFNDTETQQQMLKLAARAIRRLGNNRATPDHSEIIQKLMLNLNVEELCSSDLDEANRQIKPQSIDTYPIDWPSVSRFDFEKISQDEVTRTALRSSLTNRNANSQKSSEAPKREKSYMEYFTARIHDSRIIDNPRELMVECQVNDIMRAMMENLMENGSLLECDQTIRKVGEHNFTSWLKREGKADAFAKAIAPLLEKKITFINNSPKGIALFKEAFLLGRLTLFKRILLDLELPLDPKLLENLEKATTDLMSAELKIPESFSEKSDIFTENPNPAERLLKLNQFLNVHLTHEELIKILNAICLNQLQLRELTETGVLPFFVDKLTSKTNSNIERLISEIAKADQKSARRLRTLLKTILTKSAALSIQLKKSLPAKIANLQLEDVTEEARVSDLSKIKFEMKFEEANQEFDNALMDMVNLDSSYATLKDLTHTAQMIYLLTKEKVSSKEIVKFEKLATAQPKLFTMLFKLIINCPSMQERLKIWTNKNKALALMIDDLLENAVSKVWKANGYNQIKSAVEYMMQICRSFEYYDFTADQMLRDSTAISEEEVQRIKMHYSLKKHLEKIKAF